MNQTVILAAGNGRRIGTGTHGKPKPLCEVSGRPLIDYALHQAAAAGCEEAIVVVGCGAELLQEYLERQDAPLAIKTVYNPDYHKPNGLSLLAARPHVEDSFFLQMADHLFCEPVLGRLADAADLGGGEMHLLVDPEPPFFEDDDATKVLVADDRIRAIGKELVHWDAVDAGYFVLNRSIFDALDEAKSVGEFTVSDGMRRVAEAGALAPVQLGGVPWVDIDTRDDWAHAEDVLCIAAPT